MLFYFLKIRSFYLVIKFNNKLFLINRLIIIEQNIFTSAYSITFNFLIFLDMLLYHKQCSLRSCGPSTCSDQVDIVGS